MPKPIVAIVGRPNVGKSTLFNRLLGERVAIVEDTPGITRDRVYGDAEWNGREFTVVDTGGLGLGDEDPFGVHIQAQAEVAINEADLILFLVDGRAGLTAGDEEVAEFFRATGRPIILVANKADNDRREADTHEFYRLGMGEVFATSAHSGRGVADVLDEVVKHLPPVEEAEEDEDRIKVAIVGRPNVGKSSLLNAILGEERVIVSPVAGTTRDAVDVPFEFEENSYTLIDTAGIRRAGKIQGSVEYYTVLRAERAIGRADVAVLVVDAAFGLADGDKRVGGLANEAGRGTVVFVNKWDLVKGQSPKEFGQVIRTQMPFLGYAPIVVGSAEGRRGMDELLEACREVSNNHTLRIPTSELNRVIREAIDRRPYSSQGREFKVYYATQVGVKPPAIALFVNNPKIVHETYLRYLENQLRASFGFSGTPVRILLRKRARETADAA
ncbi:MAG TPA: ribosome biogenesis GTPase Der [Armatimonadota bacterium]|jgi:GTP-binding protein|nr:ribosome biogenesis GTPase Der [Armatimonadota bacterium]